MIQWQSVISQNNLHKSNIYTYVYDLRILVLSSIWVVPWIFEKFRNTAQAQLFNFKDPIK